MKELIKKIPIIRSLAKVVYFTMIDPFKRFRGSDHYWKERYKAGGNSGPGSYSKLALYKSEILNEFVRDQDIRTVIEFGCGDGNQLKTAEYSSYVGYDVSPEALSQCRKMYSADSTKTFKLVEDYADESAELTLSLDVVYHLTEDDVFASYMQRLFDAATRFVVVYSSNTDAQDKYQAPHLRNREFTKWIGEYKPQWKLMKHIPNKFPFTGYNVESTIADFYVYEKV